MEHFTAYEQQVIREIAKHTIDPNMIEGALRKIGAPTEYVIKKIQKNNNDLVKKVTNKINQTVANGAKKAIKAANHLCSDQSIIAEYQKKGISIKDYGEVKKATLHEMDMVADSCDFSNAVYIGLEGVVFATATTIAEGTGVGVLAIPTLIGIDVASSLTLLSRNVCQIATSYGYSSQDPANLPYLLTAMTPQSHGDEGGYLASKAAVINASYEAQKFMGKNIGQVFNDGNLAKQAPRLLHIINSLAQRLNIIITEKELGMLVPLAGILMNAGTNVAFQQSSHRNAKDYFRRLTLENRYRDEIVAKAIKSEIEKLRNTSECYNTQVI